MYQFKKNLLKELVDVIYLNTLYVSVQVSLDIVSGVSSTFKYIICISSRLKNSNCRGIIFI